MTIGSRLKYIYIFTSWSRVLNKDGKHGQDGYTFLSIQKSGKAIEVRREVSQSVGFLLESKRGKNELVSHFYCTLVYIIFFTFCLHYEYNIKCLRSHL